MKSYTNHSGFPRAASAKWLIIAFACLCLNHATAFAFEAGWARVDITPNFAAPLAGFGGRFGKGYQGVNDRLHARAIVLQKGTEKIALVSADLVAINRALREAVMKRLKARGLAVSAFTFVATHTHSSFGGYWENLIAERTSMGTFNEKIFEFLTARIVEAVSKADAAKTPARLGVAATTVTGFSRNRRAAARPIDRELTVIRIDDDNGQPKAVIVNFAAHATILGVKNHALSADFPGAVAHALEKHVEVALFTVGASGDVRPLTPSGKDRYDRVRSYGQALAEKALELLQPIRTEEVVRLRSKTIEIDLPPATLYGAMGYASLAFDFWFRRYVQTKTVLQAVAINDLALTAWPTEPVAAIGVEFKKFARERAGIPRPILISLANDYIGYMPTESDFSNWGYEVTSSFFGPKLANTLTIAMHDLLRELK